MQGFREALTAQGVRVGQRVVFVDELRVGLIGQVRRRWTARGVKWCQAGGAFVQVAVLAGSGRPVVGSGVVAWVGAFGEGGGCGGVV